jgi:hypothetical protein
MCGARHTDTASQTTTTNKVTDFAARRHIPIGVGPAQTSGSFRIQSPEISEYEHGKIAVVRSMTTRSNPAQLRSAHDRSGNRETSGATQSIYCGDPTLFVKINASQTNKLDATT